MRKKETLTRYDILAHKTLDYIYTYIDTDINMNDLANELNVNKFHLHKLFKEQMGVNIYETIKSIRLQKASSLLLTNVHSTITQISNQCGYSSQTSFITAFKKRFNQTPTAWRKGGYLEYSNDILKKTAFDLTQNMGDKRYTTLEKMDYSKLEVKIVKSKAKKVFYIQQRGFFYDKAIENWQKLQAWRYTNGIEAFTQVSIFYDNPVITAAKDCFYAAAIMPKNIKQCKDISLSSTVLEESLCAVFHIKGVRGDILPLIQWSYHEWLPKSGYSATVRPSYAIFTKNPIFDEDNELEASFYLPIEYH